MFVLHSDGSCCVYDGWLEGGGGAVVFMIAGWKGGLLCL